MIELPTWIVVMQWSLIIVLAALVWSVYRQLGILLDRNVPDHLHMALAPGTVAPSFEGSLMGRTSSARARVSLVGVPTVLAFVDPHCTSCEEVLQTLKELRAAPPIAVTRYVVATDSSAARAKWPDSVELETYLVSSGVLKRYGVTATPTIFCIAESGEIISRLIPQDRKNLVNEVARLNHSLPVMAVS